MSVVRVRGRVAHDRLQNLSLADCNNDTIYLKFVKCLPSKTADWKFTLPYVRLCPGGCVFCYKHALSIPWMDLRDHRNKCYYFTPFIYNWLKHVNIIDIIDIVLYSDRNILISYISRECLWAGLYFRICNLLCKQGLATQYFLYHVYFRAGKIYQS